MNHLPTVPGLTFRCRYIMAHTGQIDKNEPIVQQIAAQSKRFQPLCSAYDIPTGDCIPDTHTQFV